MTFKLLKIGVLVSIFTICGCVSWAMSKQTEPKHIATFKINKNGIIKTQKNILFEKCNGEQYQTGPNWIGFTNDKSEYPHIPEGHDHFYKNCKGEISIDSVKYLFGGHFPGDARYGMVLVSNESKEFPWLGCKDEQKKSTIEIDFSKCTEYFEFIEPIFLKIMRGGGK